MILRHRRWSVPFHQGQALLKGSLTLGASIPTVAERTGISRLDIINVRNDDEPLAAVATLVFIDAPRAIVSFFRHLNRLQC
jgi:hypothetical protein